ncbi:hypothetical protein ASF53_05150 [Methylobacterium sp. Leaf123]|uniref:hypothetical protein n=1 Tax=Methylobacterium sp. Leaf123 TaxID=1736264 RepID=UPI00070237EB|nr:hypothetical protein [Methylobacterium sp. Leaf123]KQQ23714.1 hypothetical protein ASF53_05150 [Methylobacterium sp. Leaf123]
MGIVDLAAERDRREAEAFDRFVTAKNRADETLRFEDAREAASAWRAFVELGMTAEQIRWLGGTVTPFERRT